MDNENLKLLELALKNDILNSSDMERIKEAMKKKTFENLKNELKPCTRTPSVKMRKINAGELVYRTKAVNQV